MNFETDYCPISTYIREYNLANRITYRQLLKLALEHNLDYIRIGVQQQYRFKNLPSITIPDTKLIKKVSAKATPKSSEGYIYLLKLYSDNEEFLGICKFGITSDIDERVKRLNSNVKEFGHYYSLHHKSELLQNPLEYETIILKYCKLRGTTLSSLRYGSTMEVFTYEPWMDNLIPINKDNK